MTHRILGGLAAVLLSISLPGCGPACPKPVGATASGDCPPGESAYSLPDSTCPVCVTSRYRDFAFCMDRVGRRSEALRKVQEAKGKLGASYGGASANVDAERLATEELKTEYGSTEAGVAACVSEFVRSAAPPGAPPASRPADPASPLREALRSNTYEIGWSNSPFGTPDRQSSTYAVVDLRFPSDDSVTFRSSRPTTNELRATMHGRKLVGTWTDVEGSGEFELVFDESFARAEGWWNFGGQTQKYNIFVRRLR